MIRLLIGITLSETGGSQQVVYDIIAGLPEDDFAITLLTAPGGSLLDRIAELNRSRRRPVRLKTIDCLSRDLSLRRDWAAWLKIRQILGRGNFDIVHFHNSKIGLLGRLAAWTAGVPVILYTMHGLAINRTNTGRFYPLVSLAERFAARLTSQVVFVAESDRIIGIRNHWAVSAASCVIPNGIADLAFPAAGLRESLHIPAELPLIMFVARLAPPKDPLLAIRMSQGLTARGIDHRLMIIGDGLLRESCARLAAQPETAGRVILLGERGDVRALLPEADLFCLFSAWEGLPVSILEAMAAGLPVLASRTGGVSELVQDGMTGYLLDTPDCQTAVHLAARLLSDRYLAQEMGFAGRQRVLTRFTLAGMVKAYRNLYETAASPAGRPSGGWRWRS